MGSLRYRGHTAAGGTEARHGKGLPNGRMDKAVAYTIKGAVLRGMFKELETPPRQRWWGALGLAPESGVLLSHLAGLQQVLSVFCRREVAMSP